MFMGDYARLGVIVSFVAKNQYKIQKFILFSVFFSLINRTTTTH